MNRCARVICRVRSESMKLASIFWSDVADMESISDEAMLEAYSLEVAADEVLGALSDAVGAAFGDDEAPDEMPLPFESLEAMDEEHLRKWLIVKIEAKAGKEFFYE